MMRRVKRLDSWPKLYQNKHYVSLRCKVLTPGRFLLWRYLLKVIGSLARLAAIAAAVAVVLPELIPVHNAPLYLIGAIGVMGFASQRNQGIACALLGQKCRVDFSEKYVVIYRMLGWSWPVRLRREHNGEKLKVSGETQSNDLAKEAEAKIRATRNQESDSVAVLAASTLQQSSFVVLTPENSGAVKIACVFDHHRAAQFVVAINAAETLLEEMAQAREEKEAESFSTAE